MGKAGGLNDFFFPLHQTWWRWLKMCHNLMQWRQRKRGGHGTSTPQYLLHPLFLEVNGLTPSKGQLWRCSVLGKGITFMYVYLYQTLASSKSGIWWLKRGWVLCVLFACVCMCVKLCMSMWEGESGEGGVTVGEMLRLSFIQLQETELWDMRYFWITSLHFLLFT